MTASVFCVLELLDLFFEGVDLILVDASCFLFFKSLLEVAVVVLKSVDLFVVNPCKEVRVQRLEELQLASHDVSPFLMEVERLLHLLEEELLRVHHFLHLPQLLHELARLLSFASGLFMHEHHLFLRHL